jgi:hypothetical protein
VAPDPSFRGILTHELAHAAFDGQPCPLENCITASEYIAYTMQIMALIAADIATFESCLNVHKKNSRDALKPITLCMDPDTLFSWARVHPNQRPDA